MASQIRRHSPTRISGRRPSVDRLSRTRRSSSSTSKACDFLLPNVDSVTAPSTQFINAAEAEVALLHPAESSDYNKLMSFWQTLPVIPVDFQFRTIRGIALLVLPGFNAAVDPCGVSYITTPKALAHEFILGIRVDQKLGNNDNIFGRYKMDHGLQPTSIDPINSLFDANSNQPSWDAQAVGDARFRSDQDKPVYGDLSHYVAIFYRRRRNPRSTMGRHSPARIHTTSPAPTPALPAFRKAATSRSISSSTTSRGRMGITPSSSAKISAATT